MGKDKRKSPRGQVSATVVLLEKGKPLGSHRVLNLSATGALLVGKVPRGAKPALEILVRLSTGRTVRAKATVARQEGLAGAAVFAIAFSGLPRADQAVISKVVLTALEDARDATALLVVAAPEDWHLLRRELTTLGHPSFVVTTRKDALRFLAEPNVLTLALVDLGLPAADVRHLLSTLSKQHPDIRRVTMAVAAKTARGTAPTRAQPLAQAVLPSPWTHDSLSRALGLAAPLA